MSNTFGNNLRLTTFGSSHSKAIGGLIEGIPKGLHIDLDYIKSDLARRQTAKSAFFSQRKEADEVEFLSGIENGESNGFPIAFQIKNIDYRSGDYDTILAKFRPSHADYTYFRKYGEIGIESLSRSSGRETASWVVAGSIAKQWLLKNGVSITSYVSQIGKVCEKKHYKELDLTKIDTNAIPTPCSDTSERMLSEIESARKKQDSLGGVATCIISGMEAGKGNPIFDKLSARLAQAMMSIPSAKGFDYGLGFDIAGMRGSEANDEFCIKNGEIHTVTNNSGGIQGGISNGEDIYFRVAFKPIPTISKTQQTVTKTGQQTKISATGRHDCCILPRVLPVVEAMAAMVIMDIYLCSISY